MDAESCCLLELGGLRDHPLDGHWKSWSTRYVGFLLPWRRCQVGFTVGASLRGNMGQVTTCSFSILGKGGSHSSARCNWLEKLTFKQQLEIYAVKCLPGRNWEMMFLPAPSALILDIKLGMGMFCTHLKSALFAIILWDSWMQAPLAFRALKDEMLDMWSNTSLLREKLEVGSSLLITWCCTRGWGIEWKSQPFLSMLMCLYSQSSNV